MTKNNETGQKILDFLCKYANEHRGVSPSYREIAKACGLKSTSVVAYYLNKLRADGIIEFQDNTPRSIEVVGARWISGAQDYWLRSSLKKLEEAANEHIDAGADEQISTDREVA